MRTLSDCLNDLKDIKKLGFNWNGYGAEPIPVKVINNATNILKSIQTGRKYPDRCLPTARETIHMEWEYKSIDKDNPCILNRDIYFGIEIYEDKCTLLLVQDVDYSNALEIVLPIQV